MLPLWLNYYLKHISPRDVYILDDNSTDDSLKALPDGINIIPLPLRAWEGQGSKGGGHSYDVLHVEGAGSQLFGYAALLAGYKCYISVDVDEILLVDPDAYPAGLRVYIDNFLLDKKAFYMKAVGKDLVHISSGNKLNIEARLDWHRPIMEQRGYWAANNVYDKILISKVPLRYAKGKHLALDIHRRDIIANNSGVMGYPKLPTSLAAYGGNNSWILSPPNNDLVLLHLHSMDIADCTAREAHKYFTLGYQFEGMRSNVSEWTKLLETKKLCGKAMSRIRKKKKTDSGKATISTTTNTTTNTTTTATVASLQVFCGGAPLSGSEPIDKKWKKSGF
jgi:hypothetical protein